MRADQAAFPVGTVIRGHYCIESLLGKGTYGALYLVRDQQVKNTQDQLFVLKQVIALTTQEQHRLIFEVTSHRQLSHKALPHVYDVFSDDGHGWVYILMEYIEGPHLDTLRQQQPEQRFSWPEAMTIMAPIIDAVGHLHRQQPPLIHSDIKPANIIVKAETRAVLVDFGIRKEYDPKATLVVGRAQSSPYQASEQVSGAGDIRTDIYGLGATLYMLLTGTVPADMTSRMTQLSNEGTDPLKPANEVVPAVPASVAQIIHRAMSAHVHDRFSSVEQFWAALRSQGEQLSPLAPRQAVTRPATVSVPKLPRASHSSRRDTSQPVAARQAVTRPATVSVPKPPRASHSSRRDTSQPVAARQAVTRPATVSVPKQPRAPRTWKWDALWPFAPKQPRAPRASMPVVVQQTVGEAATLATPEQQPTAYTPEPIVIEPAMEEAMTVVMPMELEALHVPEPIVTEPAVEEAATMVVPMELEELYAPEPIVAEPAVEEAATVDAPKQQLAPYTPEPIVAEPAMEEAATVVAPMELEELHAPELVGAEPGAEEPETVSVVEYPEELHTPEPAVEQTVEEVATVSPSKQPEELWAPEPIVEQAVEEAAILAVAKQPEELYAPEPVVPQQAVEEPETISVLEPLEELYTPEPVVAQQAVAEAASVSAPKQPRTPALKLAIPKRAVKRNAPASRAKQRRAAPRAWTFAVLLILLVLLLGLAVIANFSFHVPSRSVTSTPRHSLTPTVRSSTPTPTSVSTILGGTYKGTIYDLPANVKTSLTLTNVQQSRGKISGYLTVGPGLFGYGPFSGTIDTTTKHFQFTVTDGAGNPTLFFEGEMQTPTSLSGDYYRCNAVQGNPCQRTTVGYGIWNVLLSP